VNRDVDRERPRVLSAELVTHHLGKEPPGGADLGYLLEDVHSAVHEDGDARRKLIDLMTARDQPASHLPDLDETERHFLNRVEPSVGDVVRVLDKW